MSDCGSFSTIDQDGDSVAVETLRQMLGTDESLTADEIQNRLSGKDPSYLLELAVAAVMATQSLQEQHCTCPYRRGMFFDSLTGIPNRNSLERKWTEVLRDVPVAAVMMLDVDHFKHVNDTYGHPVGDVVLRAVAQRIVNVVREKGFRECDFGCRLGGEEFAVVMPNMDDPVMAEALANRIREHVCETPVRVAGSDIVLDIRVSIGVAIANPVGVLGDILKRADVALYRAKQAGRNRVVFNHE